MNHRIHRGELPGCLADVEDNAYHGILTDGPYMLEPDVDIAALLSFWLGFGPEPRNPGGMLGRKWDRIPPPSAWREYLRVTRPGGVCFAFSHARTYHLQALAMQLAGWRILPMIVRIHGSAMALGHAVGKAIDKAAGAEREVVGKAAGFCAGRRPGFSTSAEGGIWSRAHEDITAPATPLAALFDGHNTALKNQLEPIVCAVKPPDGTWAENAERWGCGAFNVQAGRVPSGPDHAAKCASVVGCDSPDPVALAGGQRPREDSYDPAGRYPSNLLLGHSLECGADWCVPGCPVRELGEMSGELKTGGEPKGEPIAHSSAARPGRRSGNSTFGGDSGTAARFFYQSRASGRERSAGCEDLLWRRAPEHPDGWELVDRETWERIGDEAAEAAKLTKGYQERMAEGYMRTLVGGRIDTLPDRGVYGQGRKPGRQNDRRQVLDVDRLDAAAYLEAARARVRTTGSPHLAVKALDGTAYLAKLLLQPVVDGVKPRLLVPYSGTGSEAIGAMLAGWEEIDTWEGSEQWNEVHRRRAAFWRELVDKRGRGEPAEMLRRWGTAIGEDPEVESVDQLPLFG